MTVQTCHRSVFFNFGCLDGWLSTTLINRQYISQESECYTSSTIDGNLSVLTDLGHIETFLHEAKMKQIEQLHLKFRRSLHFSQIEDLRDDFNEIVELIIEFTLMELSRLRKFVICISFRSTKRHPHTSSMRKDISSLTSQRINHVTKREICGLISNGKRV